MKILTFNQLEELKEFDSPTVSNAIERFDIRPRSEGFMLPEVKSILEYDRPVVGYASTAKVSARKPATPEQKGMLVKYYEHVKESPVPTITVIQDLDPEPFGSFWGEIQATTHKALGCVGVITNGGVRDLDEVQAMGFRYFANCVLVSHAYIHVEDYACEVEVGGLKVRPGDLLHADKHGVVLIPEEIAPEIAAACRKIQQAEEPFIQKCQDSFGKGTGVEVAELMKWREEMVRIRAGK